MRFLYIAGVLTVAILVALIIAQAEDGGYVLSDRGIEIEISPFPSPTPTPIPSLEDYCLGEQLSGFGERALPAKISPLFVALLEENGGRIMSEIFCIFPQDGGYTVVLDFREDADPVEQVLGWFDENFGALGYDVCELMMQLNVVTLRDEGGHPVILCESEPDKEEPGEQGGSGIVWRLSELLDRRHFLFQI